MPKAGLDGRASLVVAASAVGNGRGGGMAVAAAAVANTGAAGLAAGKLSVASARNSDSVQ
eukprot:365099-Chlamydomonas_euryale.AAC.8